MRALLDANVFISYLLNPAGGSAVDTVLEASLSGEFTLVVPDELLQEFVRRVTTKKYLAQRITADGLAALVRALLTVAERIPAIPDEIPAIARDPKDDYLLAYALVGLADYLVTGDDDLLSLRTVGRVRIVSPRDFVRELRLQQEPGDAP